ncbi:MAG: glycoside hydrolase [Verrucomicrobiae bacterium]|nr:glycoside hydrolase [Verrucomicrobiae bacterium]
MKILAVLPILGGLLFSAQSAPIITNAGFEASLGGWRTWSREPGALKAALDPASPHAGQAALRLEHTGEQDWCLEPQVRLQVQPGEVYEYTAWLKLPEEGNASLCVSTWDAQGQVVDWSFANAPARRGSAWQLVRSRLVVPPGVTQLQPRLIGYGPARLWVDDFVLEYRTNVLAMRPANLPASFQIQNRRLTVQLNTADATFHVEDRRTGQIWRQSPATPDLLVKQVVRRGQTLEVELFNVALALDLTATLRLEGEAPELSLSLSATGALTSALRYPHPFLSEAGQYLVVPMNEGISYPVEDASIELFRLIAYGGHGICMAFWGVTDGARGHMAIIETPDDAAIKLQRAQQKLVIAPEWDPQKRQFGYPRKLRYVFFDQGGHVAIAKRYRAYAQKIGLFKTLAEKRRENPHVDLLIGAVNVWCWERDAVSLVQEMQAAGIERILWSNRQTPENLRALNALPGVLTSRYDIYQDVMNPEYFPRLRGVHSDWVTPAWPKDIIVGANGEYIRGWGVEAKDGSMIYCGVICDRQALAYARERIPPELATHPYRCRFIDTTTAAPWHECYSPAHPMTRTESRQFKMELLRYVSEECKLVTGCETGHDASVPFLHYFEGMLSLGPYRVPDAGRRMSQIWTNVPERVAKFQVGHQYRLPLWELVYHDCVVAQWYWGDYNNKLPALWDKRDLFNLLYGTPPMFMFNRKLWEENKARFVQSYQTICPTVRRVGYLEMTDHRFLTPERTVQQTRFADGTTVTVNFGENPFRLPNGQIVKALGYVVGK